MRSFGAPNKVTLIYVPQHHGVKGNENVNVLAKITIESKFIGEPFLGNLKITANGIILKRIVSN